MVRSALLGLLLLVGVSFVGAQEQVTKEIPLWHQSAVEMAALFNPAIAPAPPLPPEPLEQVALRYAARAVADVGHTAWHWQGFVEVWPASLPRPGEPTTGAGLTKLLPSGLAGPPMALLWRNSLKVTGTQEAINRLREIIALLDRPAVRMALDVSFISLEPAQAAKLPDVDWSSLADDKEDERRHFYFAHGDCSKLLANPAINPSPLTTTVTVGNNATTAVTVVEAMPYYFRRAEAAPPDLVTRVRALRLTLTPRRNADDSVTVLVRTEYLAAKAAGEEPEELAEEGRWLAERETQVRAAAGGSVLLRGLGGDGPSWSGGSPEFGSQHLLYPLVVVTPRPLPAEEAYLCDAGPLEGDVKNQLLNAIFGKALRNGVDGIMAGLDEEGYTMVWYQAAPNQWEPAVKLPLYMLGPMVHILADPAVANGKYRRTDPTGAELDITVTRQQVGGKPGVVLTWPKP